MNQLERKTIFLYIKQESKILSRIMHFCKTEKKSSKYHLSVQGASKECMYTCKITSLLWYLKLLFKIKMYHEILPSLIPRRPGQSRMGNLFPWNLNRPSMLTSPDGRNNHHSRYPFCCISPASNSPSLIAIDDNLRSGYPASFHVGKLSKGET